MSRPEDRRRRALSLVQEGLRLHLEARVEEAVACYAASLDVEPTAEAYTYRGWAYSQEGRLDEAIAECRRAIDVDPTLGNPYNDIGSYLILQERFDEAIEWLESAKRSIRYDARHFPCLNLGRIYLVRGLLLRARDEFRAALAIHPGDERALSGLARIDAALN